MRRFPRVSALCLAAGLTPVLLSLTLGSVPPGAQAAPPTPVTRESTLPAGFTMSASDLAPGASTASGIAPALPLISPYPDLGGWPVTFPGAAGPPVAADIDTAYAGLEVLFGTLSSGVNLYAVHADGTPVPGWPVDVGFFVAGSPAVADLDGDGSLDVAAGDFGSNSVWALRADGTPMPGWPIPVGANVRSTPAIADLDPAYPGLEVVVGVQDGTVQAWHADGTPVPGWPAHAGNFVERSSPAIADVNNDGSLEVFIGSWYDGMAAAPRHAHLGGGLAGGGRHGRGRAPGHRGRHLRDERARLRVARRRNARERLADERAARRGQRLQHDLFTRRGGPGRRRPPGGRHRLHRELRCRLRLA
jgi:hypothetical protein